MEYKWMRLCVHLIPALGRQKPADLLSWRPGSSTLWVPGQPGPHSATLYSWIKPRGTSQKSPVWKRSVLWVNNAVSVCWPSRGCFWGRGSSQCPQKAPPVAALLNKGASQVANSVISHPLALWRNRTWPASCSLVLPLSLSTWHAFPQGRVVRSPVSVPFQGCWLLPGR